MMDFKHLSKKQRIALYIIILLCILVIIFSSIHRRKVNPTGSLMGTTFQTSNYPYVAAVNSNGDLMSVSATELMVPTGTIMMWATNTIPTGWLECNGQSCSQYTDLANVLSSQTVPNLSGYVPVGYSATDSNFNTLLKNVGSDTVTLTTDNLPSHNHGLTFQPTNDNNTTWLNGTYQTFRVPIAGSYTNHVQPFKGTGAVTCLDTNGSLSQLSVGINNQTTNVGNGSAVSVIQPSVVLKFIIKT